MEERRLVWWVVWLVVGGFHTSAALQESDYLATYLEDPLQPVWDRLDAISSDILKGFREQLEAYTVSTQASLRGLDLKLAALEDKLDAAFRNMREEVGDVVSDRLVNAEAIIIEEITDLTANMTSKARDLGTLDAKVSAMATRLQDLGNKTEGREANCSSVVESAVAAVEARLEGLEQRLEEVAAGLEESSQAGAGRDSGDINTAEAALGQLGQISSTYLPSDCSDVHWHRPEAPSGIFRTFPTLDFKDPVATYCDMGQRGDKESGGWTVILRRHNTSWGLNDFNRTWIEYGEGFGQPGEGEWWFGLAHLHALTYRQPFEANFLLHDIELGTFQASYNTFRVESEGRNFRLVVSGFSGNVTFDALGSQHHGRPFSTFDRDLDAYSEGSCASNNGGGWWYDRCHKAALTATFPTGPDRSVRTIRWYTTSAWLVLNDVTVKIRPTNYGQRFSAYMDGE